MINLDNKVALITGSSDGIGKAAAVLFSSLGAKVAIVGRDQTKLDQVASECEAKSPHNYKPVVIKADFTRDEDVVRTFEETISAYKHLDILVNNAGLGGTKDIRDPDYIHDYDRVQQVNVRSVVRLTELSIPHLVKSKGLIVNVSSVVAVKPSEKFWYYSMSKAALDMFTKTMALKLAPHVRVNSVNPGPVRTRFLSPLVPDTNTVYEDMDKRQPLGRVGDPNEIANVIAFLSSEASSNMTGSIVFSDSGYLLAE
ncbi:uncharacterized protein LOC107370618 [Tetranychus urticae]|uniref:Uncharacterized protein n=1 Tax=Tetranychus urticae TaxID=32264 RepID=T1KA53_TETUR|nr:uncharacterized protein LOC107361527 [Tetranychus urticae]XP_015794075.1 uncharacterized protein LOC107370616 [Tetranychus urticae]XP_015794077.1 uncharacterized protein LOC107370618 [Tetranychus urticae]